MKTSDLMMHLQQTGIEDYIGVPDSTLQAFCDDLNLHVGEKHHFVTVNEGAAVALGAGCYISNGKPVCVYMQNSGIGNAINPIVSLINEHGYDIPMLFLIGYRGEPGVKDEPQHLFQGEITLPLLDVLHIPYAILDGDTTITQLHEIFQRVKQALSQHKQYALVIRKGTFEKAERYHFENGYSLIREDAIQTILKTMKEEDVIVSTTGKISREVYEQSEQLYHHHNHVFLTVGSMGHASMIAQGIAVNMPHKRVFCLDGDGAALMHMGSMAFIANQHQRNLVHIVLNNQCHESVGGMPTNCPQLSFAAVAKACGYAYVQHVETAAALEKALYEIPKDGPVLIEVMVAVSSRPDLGRPKERAVENKEAFMAYLHKEEKTK